MNIREIAKQVGVSSTTVSRVINNTGYVSEETREKVLQVIRDNNYVPSAIARSLSIQNTFSIGVIVPDIENPFFASVIKGITEISEKNKYNIMFFDTNESVSQEHLYLESVVSNRLNGVIITPIKEDDAETKIRLNQLTSLKIPVVLVDRDIHDGMFDGVFVDNIQSSYEGVRALIAEGHQRIATIAGPQYSKPGIERLKGYHKALIEAGIEVEDQYIVEGDFKVAKAFELTRQLLDLPLPPTAIFSSNNLTTLGCLKYLTENHLVIGKDISLLGFDDIEILKIIDFKLSVVDRDPYIQGREAMNILLKRLSESGIHGDPMIVTIPHQIILRGSEKIMNQKR